MSKITVIVVEPSKKPYIKEIENTLKSFQHEVDGYIQAVYPWENDLVGLIVDEEAKLTGKLLNRVLRDERGNIYDIVAGSFLIVGLSEDDFCSLNNEQIEKFSRLFQTPELFIMGEDGIIVLPDV